VIIGEPTRRTRHALGAGQSARALIALLLLVAVLALACQNGSDGRSTEGSEPPVGWQPPADATPPGRGLLIARDHGLVLRDVSDGAERVLIPAAQGTAIAYPRWSPDGRQIAYVVKTFPTVDPAKDWGGDIVVSSSAGDEPRTVYRHRTPGTQVEGIAWSADGAGLYLALIEPVIANGRPTPGTLRLDRLDLASGARTTVVEGAAYPDASPDGRSIAYLTYSSGLESGGLWVARPDGSERRRTLTVPGRFAGLRAPRFSPDSSRLAFGAIAAEDASLPPVVCPSGRRLPWQPRTAEAHGPPVDLWTVALDGSGLALLADLDADDPALAWSPDGSAVAAIDTCRLSVVQLTGSDTTRIGPGAYLSQIDWR
jgi:Tol biopolymer transport system component